MWCWTLSILLLVSVAKPILGQSGEGEWGSGIDISSSTLALAGNTSRPVVEELLRVASVSVSPAPITPLPPPLPPQDDEPESDPCSAHFHTNTVSARRLKAYKEELAYLRAIQFGNRAIMENLVQYVDAETGDQRYADVIRENIIRIKEDHVSCEGVTQKALEGLEKQLDGDVMATLAGMQKIREESVAFDDMRRAAADIAGRLEISAQALQASFTMKLKNTALHVHR